MEASAPERAKQKAFSSQSTGNTIRKNIEILARTLVSVVRQPRGLRRSLWSHCSEDLESSGYLLIEGHKTFLLFFCLAD